MSSVDSASDRNNYTEAVRRARDEYKTAEENKEAQHRAEVKKMTQMHNDQMAKLEKAYQETIQNIKNETRHLMTDQDVQHNRDVEGVKKLYRQQLEKTMRDNQTMTDAERGAHAESVRQLKESSDQQKNNLSEIYEGDIHKKDQDYKEYVQRTGEEVERDRTRQRDQLQAAHEDELKGLHQQHEKQAMENDRDMRKTRQAKDAQLNSLKTRLEGQIARERKSFTDRLSSETQAHHDSLALNRKLTQDGLHSAQQEFVEKSENQKDNYENSMNSLERNVNQRWASRADQLENDKKELEDKLVFQRQDLTAKKGHETQNLMDENVRNFKLYDQQKQQILGQTNDIIAKDSQKTHDEANKLVGDTHRYYRNVMNLEDLKNSENKSQLLSEHEAEVDHLKRVSTERNTTLTSNYEADQKKTAQHYNKAMEELKNSQSDKLNHQSLKNLEERNKMFTHFNKIMREKDAEFEDKINYQRTGFEKVVVEQRDMNNQNVKQLKTQAERRVEEMKKANDLQLQAQEAQFQSRFKVVTEQNQKDKESMQRRFEARLEEIMKGLRTRST